VKPGREDHRLLEKLKELPKQGKQTYLQKVTTNKRGTTDGLTRRLGDEGTGNEETITYNVLARSKGKPSIH